MRRLNVVISRSVNAREEYDIPEGVILVSSLDEALEVLCKGEHEEGVERVFVIGGSTVYADALERAHLCDQVYMTEVSSAPNTQVSARPSQCAK